MLQELISYITPRIDRVTVSIEPNLLPFEPGIPTIYILRLQAQVEGEIFVSEHAISPSEFVTVFDQVFDGARDAIREAIQKYAEGKHGRPKFNWRKHEL